MGMLMKKANGPRRQGLSVRQLTERLRALLLVSLPDHPNACLQVSVCAQNVSFTVGLRTILESMGHGPERYVNLLLLATVDLFEVSSIVGVLFVVGRLLLRIPAKALIFASVSSAW